LKTFYARRSLRIFPLYYLMLGIMLLIGQVTFSGYFLSLLTYTQNIHIAIHNDWGPIGHFWSLATEEQFYFVWPLIVFLAPRRFLAPGLIAAAAVAIGFRLYGTATGMGLGDYTLPIASLDTLSLGALLALLHHSGETRLRGMLHRYGAWLLLAPVAMIFAPKQIGFLNATAIGLASLYLIEASVAGFKGAVGKAFELPPIVYLGQISYGIYVFHRVAPLIVPHQLADLFGANLRPYAEAGIYTLVTIALAALSWRFFEKPINDLKDRIRL
jgi:peptidoglycan/LPS O-acetylase OafA/YrhL